MRRSLIAVIVVATCLIAPSVASAATLTQGDMNALARKVARNQLSHGWIDADKYSYSCVRDSNSTGHCRIVFYGGSVGRCYVVIRTWATKDGYVHSRGNGNGNCY